MRRNLSEIQLLQRKICKERDEAAFASLFRILYAPLYRFAMQYVHRDEIAEEVVNDVFIKIWKQKGNLDEIQNLESYAFISVKNGSINYLKQYSHYHVAITEDNSAGLTAMHDPQKDLEWKELYFKLQQAVNALPLQCRAVFRLVKEEGFRMKQAAEILNISPRTVETQLYRAIKKLDAVLNEHFIKKGNTNNLISIFLFIVTMVSAAY